MGSRRNQEARQGGARKGSGGQARRSQGARRGQESGRTVARRRQEQLGGQAREASGTRKDQEARPPGALGQDHGGPGGTKRPGISL